MELMEQAEETMGETAVQPEGDYGDTVNPDHVTDPDLSTRMLNTPPTSRPPEIIPATSQGYKTRSGRSVKLPKRYEQ